MKMESLHLDKSESAHLALAKELMRTCVAMYEISPLGLHPEIAKFDQDSNNVVKCFGGDLCVSANDAHSILRPETVESLFVLYRVTKDESLRRHGWRMWQNWERITRGSRDRRIRQSRKRLGKSTREEKREARKLFPIRNIEISIFCFSATTK